MEVTALLHKFSLILAALAAACSLAAQNQPPAQPEATPARTSLYRLVRGDTVEIRLFYNPELNEQVQIRPDGRVSLQLIGEVEIAGKTISEAVSMLEQQYVKQVKRPSLTIQVRTFAAQKVFVTGEVNRPGLINIPAPTTIYEAIAEAGGIKNTGNRKMAILVRKRDDGRPERRNILLADNRGVTAESGMVLAPFDVVMIPESRITRVDRWVDQYIRQLSPVVLTTGFNYLLTHQTGVGSAVPILP